MRFLAHVLSALAAWVGLGSLLPVFAQDAKPASQASATEKPTLDDIAVERDRKQAEATDKVLQILHGVQTETKQFAEPMPFAKFLELLATQLPEAKRFSFRVDKEAFGDRAAQLTSTRITFPPYPRQMYLSTALSLAKSQIKIQHDYRVSENEYVITSPERALFTAAYDIRDVLEKPEILSLDARPWNAFRENLVDRNQNSTEKAVQLVQTLVANVDLPAAPATIRVFNGTRLVIRANAAKHAEVAGFLGAVRRLGDLSVIATARLYEVDEPIYRKVHSAKRLTRKDWDEIEQKFLNGIPQEGGSLFKDLDKQPLVLAGGEVKVENGFEATLLARHDTITCGPGPLQFRKGDKGPQAVLVGVSFVGGIHVSPDRRYVRIQLHEKATELQAIEKRKQLVNNEGQEVEIETPLLKESAHTDVFEIPDGGAILLSVHHRPRALQDKNRWWVLSLEARIYIDEEEQVIRSSRFAEILNAVVADVLKNPRLKATRDFYGTPGDTRFALVDGSAWIWPEKSRPSVAGFELSQPKREGKRLLGIRVDRLQEADKVNPKPMISITLVNAGGSANGAVLGGCALRYSARQAAKGWEVELNEPTENR